MQRSHVQPTCKGLLLGRLSAAFVARPCPLLFPALHPVGLRHTLLLFCDISRPLFYPETRDVGLRGTICHLYLKLWCQLQPSFAAGRPPSYTFASVQTVHSALIDQGFSGIISSVWAGKAALASRDSAIHITCCCLLSKHARSECVRLIRPRCDLQSQTLAYVGTAALKAERSSLTQISTAPAARYNGAPLSAGPSQQRHLNTAVISLTAPPA